MRDVYINYGCHGFWGIVVYSLHFLTIWCKEPLLPRDIDDVGKYVEIKEFSESQHVTM